MAIVVDNLTFSYKTGLPRRSAPHNDKHSGAHCFSPRNSLVIASTVAEHSTGSAKQSSPLIDNYSAIFDRGKITAITGANGCGKTTLSKLLVGMLKPYNGIVTIDGEDISNLTLAETGRKVGLVMQEPSRQMFCTSVKDEMDFGLQNLKLSDEEIKERREYYLDYFGLSGYEDRFPFSLSTGEKQRLVIATVIATRPEYLILDEPTSALDRGRRAEFGELIKKLAKEEGIGIILISHDVNFVKEYADVNLPMDGVKKGTHPFGECPQSQLSHSRVISDGACPGLRRGEPQFCLLSRVDPRPKLLLMIAASTVCMLTNSLIFVTAVLTVLIITLLIGGANFINIFKKARALLALIVFLFIIQAVFMGIPQGIELAGLLSLRLLVIVVAAFVLLEGDIRDYLLALVQMKIPYSFAFMVMVGLHFIPILRDEAVNVYNCMQLRGRDFKKIGIVKKIKAYAKICLPVMASALRRAEETSIAMEMRAFRAKKGRSNMRRLMMNALDICLCIFWPAIFIILYLIFI